MKARWFVASWILAAAPAAGFAPQEPPAGGDRIAALLAELGGPGVEGVRAALDELLEIGGPAASAALEGFSESGLTARRLRARLVREKGGDDCIPAAAGWTTDPDREVRGSMLAFLGERLRAATSTGFDELGFEALTWTAREDSEVELRLEALRALARSDHALATRALEGLALELTPPERTLAAGALAEQPRGRSIVVARVQGAFAAQGTDALPPDVLAVWMGFYGARLAELPQGGVAASDRAPFLVGRRHPEPSVRLAARVSLERFLLRLVELGDPERGEAVLDQLIAAEPEEFDHASRRATYTLEHAADASGALRAAREVSRRALTSKRAEEATERVAAAVGFVLEAAALVALELPEEARQPLGRARVLLDSLAAERLELREPGLAQLGAALFEQRAVVELYFALCLNMQDGAQAEALEHARRAHVLSLEAQLSKTNAPLTRLTASLDGVVGHPLSPFALLFQNQRQRAIGRERVLELELRLCRALATAAPIEMPGFAEAAETELDQERWYLLGRILRGLKDQVSDLGRKAEDPEQGRILRNNIMRVLNQIRERPQYLRLRVPCSYGLVRAATLREEGRAVEARELAQRVLAHLDRVDFTLEAEEGERMRMSTQMAIGTSLTDEGEPQQAEQMLLMALERAEAIERGRGGAGLGALRANILISLAVNANVKLADPDKALGYFERAFELDDNEFTRTLLACYRARAGRVEEAREALKQTVVSPQNYYNLACTHALLGDRERAVELLRRALDENFLTPGSRERQRAWARDDPDLKSLRGDPRFEALLRR